MSYEIVVKKQRAEAGQERVSISSNGRLFLLSSAVVQKYFADAPYAQIFADKDIDGSKIRIALRPMKKTEQNTYSVVRPKKSKSGYITSKAALSEIGYKNNEVYSAEARWVERTINGRKTWVVEFEVDKKFCSK